MDKETQEALEALKLLKSHGLSVAAQYTGHTAEVINHEIHEAYNKVYDILRKLR